MYNRKFKQNVLTASLKTIILSPLCWAPLVYAENGVQQLDTIMSLSDLKIFRRCAFLQMNMDNLQ